MDKNLIGWVVIVFEQDSLKEVCRTYYRFKQKNLMCDEVTLRIEQDQTFKVVPGFGTPRKVLY